MIKLGQIYNEIKLFSNNDITSGKIIKLYKNILKEYSYNYNYNLPITSLYQELHEKELLKSGYHEEDWRDIERYEKNKQFDKLRQIYIILLDFYKKMDKK